MVGGVFFSLSSILFLIYLLGGIWVSLVSVGLMGFWVGLELSFLGLIPLIVSFSVEEAESCMKYYIVQVIGSMFFMMGLVFFYSGVFLLIEQIFIVGGMMIKLGVFPFYFWVPIVMSKLSWISCFYIMVFQKISPIWLFSNMGLMGTDLCIVEEVVVLTAFVGCLGGLGVLQYRVLLAYSSLVHLGWMLMAALVDFELFLLYMLVYSFILGGFMGTMWFYGVYSYMDLFKEKNFYNSVLSLWVCLYSLSLAGLPPLSGSFLKVLFIYECWMFFPLSSCFLLMSVMVSLYFYLCIFFELVLYSGSRLGLMGVNLYSKLGIFGSVAIILNLILGFPLFMGLGSIMF